MPDQRTALSSARTPRRPRVARRYRTCAEALRAVSELEQLAEDEVSHLREQGREAEADRRADAWNREIARALGEAEGLRQDVADTPQTRITATGQRTLPGPLRMSAQSPSRLLANAAVALIAAVVAAQVIEALQPELLTAALITASLSFLLRSRRSRRRRTRHGR
jgi:hypothetical protein